MNLQEYATEFDAGWTPTPPANYSIDASDIPGDKLYCPKCGKLLPRLDANGWHQQIDRENEVLNWYLNHGCGAYLTVWNE